MSSLKEASAGIIRRLVQEVLNEGKLEVIDELFAWDFVDWSTEDQPPGPEGVKQYVATVRAGFPDLRVSIDELVPVRDRVVVQTTWRGTHQGEYGGVAPTGEEVSRILVQTFRIANGKIQSETNQGTDMLG